MKIEIKTKETFNTFAARRILSIIEKTVDTKKFCTVALSGGKTPMGIFREMVAIQSEFDINWRRVFFFWGDERMVDAESDNNNAHMAQINLLDHLPVPSFNIFPFRTDLSVTHAAADMEEKLRNHLEVLSTNSIDLVLLGLGEDGHTLSLFPNSYALKVRDQWAYGYLASPTLGERLTLLPEVVNNAEYVLFLVTGANKAATVQKVLYSKYDPDVTPAQVIRPITGNLEWILDEDAGSLVKVNPKKK